MPQVFHKRSNYFARGSLVFGGVFLLGVVLISHNVTSYTHDLYVAFDQPAPFSHKHHVKELGIDCRYCHTSVEKGPFAGVPPTETCYTCHSQIWTNSPLLQVVRDSYTSKTPMQWNRVNNVPDFVFFDHSVHVAKGVSCYTCHGPVDKMNLIYKENAFEMSWCLKCHKNPEAQVRPTSELFNSAYDPAQHAEDGKRLVEQYGIKKEQLSDCWICHR